MKQTMIRIGNFFFKHRNRAFPAIIAFLYLLSAPPQELFGSINAEHAKDVFALLMAVSGLALRALVIGYVYIKRGGLNKKVYAENLVTSGIFGLCRNPLYVGNILIYSGVFLMHGNPLVIALGIGSYLFIYQCIVLAEEAYLENKFEAAYTEYCHDVSRWKIDFSKFREATEGMQFRFKRVILKDYTTIASTIIALVITESYEYLAASPFSAHSSYLTTLIAIGCATVAATLAIRYMKKSRILIETPIA